MAVTNDEDDKKSKMRVVIAGGGTGGHVFPALALADEIRAQCPDSEVLFVGSAGGLEERLVPNHGYALHLLQVGKLKGATLKERAVTILGLPAAGLAAARLLRGFAPDVVVGVGGYASGPIALTAKLLGFPVVLMEQNSIPGLTNRLLSHIADKIIIHFNEASRHFSPGRTVRLGNPIRPHLLTVLTTAHTTVPLSGSSAAPGLLILGGSQGAHILNQLVTDAAPALVRRVPGLRLIHQTGNKDRDWVAKAYQSAGITVRVEAFIEDMAQVYSEVDLVISRSGAMTLAELCVAGLPALLIPYPFAADDHQAVNARELELAGGAVVFKQNEVTVQKLIEEAGALLVDSQRRMQMSEAMRKNGFPQAAADIVHLLSGWLQS